MKKVVGRLALKFYREKVTLHEARKIGTEIAYQGYEKWCTAKPDNIEENGAVRCAKCGAKVSNEDHPWLPLCTQHKYEFLAQRTKIENPHKPLHEIDPVLHRLRVKDGNVLNPEKMDAITTIYSKEKRSIKDVNVLNDHENASGKPDKRPNNQEEQAGRSKGSL